LSQPRRDTADPRKSKNSKGKSENLSHLPDFAFLLLPFYLSFLPRATELSIAELYPIHSSKSTLFTKKYYPVKNQPKNYKKQRKT
jgi:hypothetical protein